jgi:hypothetical protein
MGVAWEWSEQNWFSLVQTVGIVAGLLFTAKTISRDQKDRRTGKLLALGEQHRELWSEAVRNPDLCRIFLEDVDLKTSPVTLREEEFLNVVIYHFNTGWELAKLGDLLSMEVFALDARTFFSRPIPNEVWRHSRFRRDPAFVAYIERCMEPG